MSDAPKGIDSAQLAAMQQGQQTATSGKPILGFLADSEGLLKKNPGLFDANIAGLFTQHKPNQLLADLGFRLDPDIGYGITDHAADVKAASHEEIYGAYMAGSVFNNNNSGSADNNSGGGGDDMLGRIRPTILVYGQSLHSAGVQDNGVFPESMLTGHGSVKPPSHGKGIRQSDYALGA